VRFADDIGIIAVTQKQLQELIDKVNGSITKPQDQRWERQTSW